MASRCSPRKSLWQVPTPAAFALNVQMPEKTVGSAKRPRTTTVYMASGVRPLNRNAEVQAVSGSVPLMPLT